jgi:hypothetical protein
MFGRNDVSDRDLIKAVNSRLTRAGGGSHVKAMVNRGVVTLTGKLQYSAQRIPVVNAASRVAGVRQVVDQMQIVPKIVTKASYSAPPIEKASAEQTAPVKSVAAIDVQNIQPPAIQAVPASNLSVN